MNLTKSIDVCYSKLMPHQLRYMSSNYIGFFLIKKLYKDLSDLPPNSPLFTSLRKEDIVIEIGTNLGNLTELIAQRVRWVYTFEPILNTQMIAKKHIRQKNVSFYNEAMDGHSGEMQFHIVSKYSGSNSLYNQTGVHPIKTSTIKVTSLDDFIQRTNIIPTVLVSDSEGSELNIVKYSNHLPNLLFMETHSLRNGIHTRPLCKELLIEKGYNVTEFPDRGNMIWLSATKN